ncbi:Receptor-like kinase LIP1 [Sesamum alatum]|uniref:Receptor-like kinase LIP1 n=1 Tax=Sesamum alatum TaxID=300844 RepID=A0AAE1YLQ9_9LAMI|nr:Receptor-like kinase LIP1 [Sesamum alatum]
MNFCDNFSFEKLLGAGGFAEIYKGIIPQANGYGLKEQTVAIKVQKPDVEQQKIEVQKLQFTNWLSKFDHPNIIKMVGYCFTDARTCLVLEYAVRGKLTDHIADLDWSTTLNIIKKLGKAIQYIHSLLGGCLHGDIKSDNVLLMEDNEPKLCDFGTMMHEGESTVLVMTPGYLNPAALNRPGGKRLQDDDVYSFAVIILQMILKSSEPMKSDPEENSDISLSHWAFKVYGEEGSFVSERLMNSGCSEESVKRISDLVREVIKPPEKAPNVMETIWQDLHLQAATAHGNWGEEGIGQFEDYSEPDMDDFPTEGSPKSPPTIFEILRMLDNVES